MILQTIRQNKASLIQIVILSLSLSLNVWLGLRLFGANAQLAPQSVVRPGDRLSLLVQESEGRVGRLKVASGKTIVYLMAPTCGWCRQNHDNVVALWHAVNGRYKFVAVSTTGYRLDKYESQYPSPFPIVRLDPATGHMDKLSGTPQTLILDQAGRVEQAWDGAFVGNRQKEIETFFGARLPGLRADEVLE